MGRNAGLLGGHAKLFQITRDVVWSKLKIGQKSKNWDKNEKLDKMKIGILPQALFLRLSETLD